MTVTSPAYRMRRNRAGMGRLGDAFIVILSFLGAAIATSVLARSPALDAWSVWASAVYEGPASGERVARNASRSC